MNLNVFKIMETKVEFIPVTESFSVVFNASLNEAGVVFIDKDSDVEVVICSVKAIDGNAVYQAADVDVKELNIELQEALQALLVAYKTIENHMVNHSEIEVKTETKVEDVKDMDNSVEDETFTKELTGAYEEYSEESEVINYDQVPTEEELNA